MIYLSLGSNIEPKKEYLDRAIEKLSKHMKILKKSSYFSNESYGPIKQDDFINLALEVDYDKSPEELLILINKIESELDRVRTIRWGKRTIDIDIIYFNNLIINSEKLSIPHYDMQNRTFVLYLLKEINCPIIHPIFKLDIDGLIDQLNKSLIK